MDFIYAASHKRKYSAIEKAIKLDMKRLAKRVQA
jgi:hypothetical protein